MVENATYITNPSGLKNISTGFVTLASVLSYVQLATVSVNADTVVFLMPTVPPTYTSLAMPTPPATTTAPVVVLVEFAVPVTNN